MECGSAWVDMNADSEEEVEFDEDEDLLERNETSEQGLFDMVTTSSSAAPPPPPPAPSVQKRKRKVRKANTNVISVKLGTLTQDVAVATGDPVFCVKCQAALSAIDVAQMAAEGKDKEKGARVWHCSFCSTDNELNLDDEEMPGEESVDYILEPPNEAVSRGSSSSEKQLIFCIDISGSMCVTTEIEGKHELKGAEARKRLDSLNTERADQWAPREKRNVTYVSRLQSVQAAVDAQLAQMEQEQPSRRVGLVTFNGEVTVIGDGYQPPVTIAGDKLDDYDQLLQLGKSQSPGVPISKAKKALSTKLFALEETGPTALGPALLVCIGMASQNPGSEIVVCTDGLSNVGLGQLDDINTEEKKRASERFYEQIGDFAVLHGVTISIIGIKGQDCRMEQLGALSDKTNGGVNIVDPLRITQEFSSILSQPIIATNVGVKLILHKGLFVRAEDGEDEKERSTTKDSFITRDVGNVTTESAFAFEFGVRPIEEAKALGIDLELSALPFQLQIRYTKLDGMKCIRIISREQKATRDREQAELAANVDVLGLNAVQKSAKIAQKGEYTAARLENFTHTKLMRKVAMGSEDKKQKFVAWGSKQRVLETELKTVKAREMDEGLALSDDDEDDECNEEAAEEKVQQRKAKKAVKEQARKDRRGDETAKVLWSFRSKRK